MAQVETDNRQQIADELVASVRDSVCATFEMICAGEIVYTGDSAGEGTSDSINGIIGIIALVGDVAWSLMVGLPKETAMQMSAKFAGFEMEYDSADMGDMVGELANVLSGDVAARLDELGVAASLSLPTVARGSDIDLIPGRVPQVRLYFDSPDGDFWIKIAAAEPRICRQSGG